jgi:hypothetical protein
MSIQYLQILGLPNILMSTQKRKAEKGTVSRKHGKTDERTRSCVEHFSDNDDPLPVDKGPGQPVLKVEDMGDVLHRLNKRPHTSWSVSEKAESYLNEKSFWS